MRAVLRASVALAAVGIAAWPVMALAQDANQVTAITNAPAPPSSTNAVGPRDLQNFSLQGTVTRAADQPVRAAPPAASSAPRANTAAAPSTTRETAAAPHESRSAPRATASTQVAESPPRAPSAEPALSSLADVASSAGAAPAEANPSLTVRTSPAPLVSQPDRGLLLWPWLLAAAMLGAGGAFLFWRNRARHAFAGGPEVDAYVVPEPAPAPQAAPAPSPQSKQAPPPPPIAGVVSTRLRPWIEIALQPIQCVVDDDKVTIDFELDLFNSGSGPARAVLAEASLFNAGANQDQAIDAFFANPAGVGERIVAIPPLKRALVRHQLVADRSQIQEYELAGQKVFVPVIAFNALYRWGGGEGQTSVAYMLGRDTKSDKLGPFRLDLGAHAFREVAARPLPGGMRA